jgi:hypothetical protein
LAERLTALADHVVLATATPHHGDDDRFGHFMRLLDPDVFPEPHRYGEQAREIRQSILSLGPDSPWAIRRLKEDLRDINGRRLFPDRHTQTVSFQLNPAEYALYQAVTAYINGNPRRVVGKKERSDSTVFQRRRFVGQRHLRRRRRLEKQGRIWNLRHTPSQRAVSG